MAKHEGSTFWAGDAKSFFSLVRVGLSSMVSARGMLNKLREPRVIPLKWDHQEDQASDFLDPSDDQRKQGNQGEGIQASAGPKVNWTVKVAC